MRAEGGIAFFDFDNTLIHGDVGPLFADYLLRDRYERLRREEGRRAADRDRLRLVTKYLPYMTWMGVQAGLYKARAVRRSRIVRSAYRGLKGIGAEEYYGLMDAFVDEEIPDRVYPEMVEIIGEHHAAGRPCVVVTTGIEALVARALRHLPDGMELIGCRLEERGGVLTGRVTGPLYGADKANIMHAYARATGVGLRDCWAYSDHYSDHQMLAAVGHGVCVNPRGRLERLAQEKGWVVLRPEAPS